MKKMLFVLLGILMIFSSFSCTKASIPGGPAVSPTPDANGFYSLSTQGMTFKWKVNGSNLDCELSGPTSGWVSVAFNSSNAMAGADYVLGYVTGGNIVHLSEEKGNNSHGHSPNTIQHITVKSGTETAGPVTKITFTRQLNSSDAQNMVLTQNMSLWVILAYGASDDFTSIHSAYGSVQTTLY